VNGSRGAANNVSQGTGERMGTLNGKVALVTGAAAGIGRAVAEAYVREGASVVLADINAGPGEAVAARLRDAGAQALFVRVDVTDPDDCGRMVAACLQRFGRLDIACNNAGIGGEANATADYSIAGWHEVIATNLNGTFYCMKHEIAAMLHSGGGAIVNMASVLGQAGFATAPAYVAAKHGVVGLTRSAALEYGTQGIRVNTVAPGFILTAMTEKHRMDPEGDAALRAFHAVERMGTAQEVAEMVLWLSSPASSFVTGSLHAVDGGYLAR
jgi:NAD(P)-dependent dehydrogenase (short-subunit alcohol dehydrogenase family)